MATQEYGFFKYRPIGLASMDGYTVDSSVARLHVMVGQTFPYRYTTVYAIIISYVHLLTAVFKNA